MTAPTFPPLIYARDSAVSETVELRIVEYEGDVKTEREWTLHPDKAISLGLQLAERGWRLKLAGNP